MAFGAQVWLSLVAIRWAATDPGELLLGRLDCTVFLGHDEIANSLFSVDLRHLLGALISDVEHHGKRATIVLLVEHHWNGATHLVGMHELGDQESRQVALVERNLSFELVHF